MADLDLYAHPWISQESTKSRSTKSQSTKSRSVETCMSALRDVLLSKVTQTKFVS